MKKIIATSCILLTVLAFQSCDGGTSIENSSDTAKSVNILSDTALIIESTDSAFIKSTGVDKYDENFATEAANGSMTEIALSKLVKKKGTGKVIKDYAIMIIQDHGDALNKLKMIAVAEKIILPETVTDLSKKIIDSLSKKKGINFNKEYITTIISDHKIAIDLFTAASKECKDSSLKNYAVQTLPALKRHLDYIEKISDKK